MKFKANRKLITTSFYTHLAVCSSDALFCMIKLPKACESLKPFLLADNLPLAVTQNCFKADGIIGLRRGLAL